MREITGTHISYYFYCKRRLWLFNNNIKCEDNSEDVAMGIVIEETAYAQRSSKYKQIEIGPIKIDFYDDKNKIIHEVKKSNKFHETHIWQLRYYIYILEQAGVHGVKGILDYPKSRATENVGLDDDSRNKLIAILADIKTILAYEEAPKMPKPMRICKKCSYYELCWI